jgi:hypothetical protein
MKNFRDLSIVSMVWAVAMALSANLHAQDFKSDFEKLTRNLPDEVSRFIYRKIGCNHWTTEEPYDTARKAEIAAAEQQLSCSKLVEDEQGLRQKYQDSDNVLHALDTASSLYY